MASSTKPRLEGDDEAFFCTLQIIVGGLVMGVTRALVIEFTRYLKMVAMATPVGTALRILTA